MYTAGESTRAVAYFVMLGRAAVSPSRPVRQKRETAMSENEQPNSEFDGELVNDGEVEALMRETERQIDVEGFERQRALAFDFLLRRRNRNDTRRGSVLSQGSAVMDANDQQGWQRLCRIEGHRQYAELQAWALLCFCDLNIWHLRVRGEKFTPKKGTQNTHAVIQSMIWAGMMDANTEWIHYQMGEAPPSPRGYMLPPDNPPATDPADPDDGI